MLDNSSFEKDNYDLNSSQPSAGLEKPFPPANPDTSSTIKPVLSAVIFPVDSFNADFTSESDDVQNSLESDSTKPEARRNLTLIYPKITYQTVQAYNKSTRIIRSITNKIPMLTESQSKQKEENENLRKYSKKILELENKIKYFSEDPLSLESGEGVVGPWVQRLFWFSGIKTEPFRTSKFGDHLEEVLDLTPNDEITFFLLWKLLERFQKTLPGFFNSARTQTEICSQNIFSYFPQFFLELVEPHLVEAVRDVSPVLLQVDEPGSVTEILTSLKLKSENMIHQKFFNSRELENKNFLGRVLLLENEKKDVGMQYLSRYYYEHRPEKLMLENRMYKLYSQVELNMEYVQQFLSIPEKNVFSGLSLQETILKTTASVMKTLTEKDSLNIEHFGNISELEQFSILLSSQLCDPNIVFLRNQSFICPT